MQTLFGLKRQPIELYHDVASLAQLCLQPQNLIRIQISIELPNFASVRDTLFYLEQSFPVGHKIDRQFLWKFLLFVFVFIYLLALFFSIFLF